MDHGIISDNTAQYALYLLTGAVPYYVCGDDFEQVADELAVFGDDNGSSRVMTASIDKGREDLILEDVNGNNVKFPSNHLYSITKVENLGLNGNDSKITVINPWDSSIEHTFDRSKLMGIFDTYTCMNLR